MAYLIIRIRGEPDLRPEVRTTLRLLRLHRIYVASVYPDNLPGIVGMLRTAQTAITWGEVDPVVLAQLIQRRGRLVGERPITDEWVKERLKLSGIMELAERIAKNELKYYELDKYGVKPFFRLHPPSGGFKRSVKKLYPEGELGYRGKEINELVQRMF
ncbi:MAG: 50S ribosomal protein L30 [Acidilobus sp.]